MKKMLRNLLAAAFAGMLVLFPVICTLGLSPALTVSAHGGCHGGGHHGGGHYSSSGPTYYYCNGHEAHCHDNGVCPYAYETAPQESPAAEYFYCDGHEAHCHDNGVCPYAYETAPQGSPAVEYFYCDGHEAHCHDNGVCPYANVSGAAPAVRSGHCSVAAPCRSAARFHAEWPRLAAYVPTHFCMCITE